MPGDILKHQTYEGLLGVSYVCFRFICSRCRRAGEGYCEQELWESSLLSEPPAPRVVEPHAKFRRMGPITDDELSTFRRALRRFRSLPEDAPVEE